MLEFYMFALKFLYNEEILIKKIKLKLTKKLKVTQNFMKMEPYV